MLVQLFLQLQKKFCLICPFLIHLVDKQNGGDLITGKQPPECLHMSLHPVRAADDQHRIIQHLQGPLHLCRKIHMSGRIQKRHVKITQYKRRLF